MLVFVIAVLIFWALIKLLLLVSVGLVQLLAAAALIIFLAKFIDRML